MALANLKFYSESLGMQTEIYVVIPQKSNVGEIGIETKKEDKKYKCLYLLHGLSDDQSIWLRRTSVERYANRHGICVVMPSGARSFYTDMKYGLKYYTYIAKELPHIVSEFFNVSDKREDNFIAGLSMGGYGALKIALRENDRFSAVAGLSSVTRLLREEFNPSVMVPIFGEELVVPENEDLFYLAEECDKKELKPRIYMAVGTEDFMYEDNVALKEKFEELNYDFSYFESEGGHTWEFWDYHIEKVLEWMLK